MDELELTDYSRVVRDRSAIFSAGIDWPTAPLEPEMSLVEYVLRVARAREWMVDRDLDALVVMSSRHGRHFTGDIEPHEWHDRCPARATWYLLTQTEDHIWLNPGMSGEHFSSARRMTHITHLHAMVERGETADRIEVWDVRQLAVSLTELGLNTRTLGFELGDCTTLG